MPNTCTVCAHTDSVLINEALVIERRSLRNIAKQFDVSYSAVNRHKQHIPELLVKAAEAMELEDAERLAIELNKVKEDVHRLKDKAEDEGDLRTALLGCDKALKALELQAKVEQLIQTAPQINVLMMPEWIALRTKFIQALDAYPEARGSVLRALEEGSNGKP
jgi:hypothetical protein